MRGWCALAALSALLFWTPAALAASYDLRLARLGNPNAGDVAYSPDANARFRAMSLELAGALNAISLIPPGSLGYSGFSVGAEAAVAPIQTSKVLIPTESPLSGPLVMPAIHIRKGLPYSFELGGKILWLEGSQMMAATLELRWAFLEGFAKLPDAAVRGHITQLINGRELNLTTGGVDLTVGKRFPVGSVHFIPYGGYDLSFVNANSGSVDFNPGRDPASGTSPGATLAGTGIFRPVLPGNSATHRVFVGVRFGLGPLRLGVEGSLTFFGKTDYSEGAQTVPLLAAFGSTLGFSF